MNPEITIEESDIHAHIKTRMQQRGISVQEIEKTINTGWAAEDAQEETFGKVFVFPYNAEWEGKFFEEKEITVYYKYKGEKLMLLTSKARYGRNFLRKE